MIALLETLNRCFVTVAPITMFPTAWTFVRLRQTGSFMLFAGRHGASRSIFFAASIMNS